ncbi:MAG: RNA binding S1 domain protein [Parcubacteria group bacterium GW2011_GWB1_41_6]|nr:MAG: RNA binding S1 domain protein [Parcubacteria group bacterium GW2011_GWB1_41_6]KKS33735.1 MAG: RNA binding S1 domain protein [Parcubacteria group bacterium GW2011_GWC2_42_13]KKS57347.1 MAG: RNA binding S1 domain protein [Parcubacteria group bacterium GW2011_GWA2_42_35]
MDRHIFYSSAGTKMLQIFFIFVNILFVMELLKNEEKRNKATPTEFFLKSVDIIFPRLGDVVEGKVIEQKGPALYIDLGALGSGIIYGREFINARDIIKSLKPGDVISAKITEFENEDGYIELSLKEAGMEIVWREVESLMKNKELLELTVTEANKGGLIMEWQGLRGFLPASQLSPSNYPRVDGGDKEKIFKELQKMIGRVLKVAIIGCDKKEQKLIFSEKESDSSAAKEALSKYKIGDEVSGEVTGIVDFGIFIRIKENLEGLVHISEIDWSLVEDLSRLFKIGQNLKVKIIGIDNNKLSLSIKALKPDPWLQAEAKYHKGDVVEGVVIRLNRYGALVSVEEGVAGLVHISEFNTFEEMQKKIEIGKTYPFKITLFEPNEHRLTLGFIDAYAEAPPSQDTPGA